MVYSGACDNFAIVLSSLPLRVPPWSLDFVGPHDLLWPINEAEGMGYNAWLRVWEALDFLWAAYTSALFRRRVHLDYPTCSRRYKRRVEQGFLSHIQPRSGNAHLS